MQTFSYIFISLLLSIFCLWIASCQWKFIFHNFLCAHYENVKLSAIKIPSSFFFVHYGKYSLLLLCMNMKRDSDRDRDGEWGKEKKIKSLCRSLNSFIIAHFFRLSSFYALEIFFSFFSLSFFLLCVWCVLKFPFIHIKKKERKKWSGSKKLFHFMWILLSFNLDNYNDDIGNLFCSKSIKSQRTSNNAYLKVPFSSFSFYFVSFSMLVTKFFITLRHFFMLDPINISL